MESVNNNLNPQEDAGQNRKVTKQRRPIFGNRIYLSHHDSPLLSNFKSASTFSMQSYSAHTVASQENQSTTRLASPDIMDSSTQTSKTILQLAKLEAEQLSPDSLTQSPRDPQLLNKNNQVDLKQVESKLQMCPSNSQTTIDSTCENLITFTRKSNITEYIHSYKPAESILEAEEISVYPQKSLTETFLERRQNEETPVSQGRSEFLQQTSPLRKLQDSSPVICNKGDEPFKSQSFVEPCDPNFVYKVYPTSRFTVKSVKEQQLIDRSQPLKCYWPPLETQNTSVALESLFQRIDEDDADKFKLHHISKNYRNRRAGSFMSPTLASEQRNQLHVVENLKHLIVPTRRGKSLSPNRNSSAAPSLARKFNAEKIPYIDQSKSQFEVNQCLIVKQEPIRKSISRRGRSPKTLMTPLATRPRFDEDLLKIDLQSLDLRTSEETINKSGQVSCSASNTSSDNIVSVTMNRIRDRDWTIALQGLAEMTELCRIMDSDLLFPHMTTVNQRLLELLRSPRSHVCRTACQAAGHFFESMKDTRRPEFDDIVEVLLYKTADANKFIRKDANLSLDCMVTHIPIFHAVRSLCIKGPIHKNPLVRTATIRLIVCAVVIAGADVVLNLPSHEPTRKRIIQYMAKFLADKHSETRKYGERLYKILCKDAVFDSYLKKYLEKDEIAHMRSTLKFRMNKR